MPKTDCPCGQAQRGFADQDQFPGTLHLTTITLDAKTHFHRQHTETYVVLECETDAKMELDGKQYPVQPMTSILIPPGVRHRAVGRMKVIIVCTPNFDPSDEFFD